MTVGTVRLWLDAEGWGVLDSAETPGGCWTHFSAVEMDGYRSLVAGQSVTFEWEPARQDGYFYSAIQVRPEGARSAGTRTPPPPSDAYASRMTIAWDEPDAGP